MSESENHIEQQHTLVAKYKSLREKKLIRNTKDIRDEIAKGAHYEPKDDPIYEYQPYPKWVTPPGQSPIVVNSKAEHEAAMGVKAEPAKAVDVDIASLAQPEQAKEKRKYTKRAAPQPLPQNLD